MLSAKEFLINGYHGNKEERLKKDSYTFKNEGNNRKYEHQEKVLESFS